MCQDSSDYSSDEDAEQRQLRRERKNEEKKKSVMVCVGAASIFAESAAIATVAINNGNKQDKEVRYTSLISI